MAITILALEKKSDIGQMIHSTLFKTSLTCCTAEADPGGRGGRTPPFRIFFFRTYGCNIEIVLETLLMKFTNKCHKILTSIIKTTFLHHLFSTVLLQILHIFILNLQKSIIVMCVILLAPSTAEADPGDKQC